MNSHEQVFYIDQIREHLNKLLPWQLSQFHDAIIAAYQAADDPSECRSCRKKIIWSKTPAGRPCPFDYESGESHFKTCPQAKDWSKAKTMTRNDLLKAQAYNQDAFKR